MRKIILPLLLALPFLLLGQYRKNENVDINKLIEDTQVSSSTDVNKVDIVWWIPKEFWETSFKQDQMTPKDQVDAMIEVIEDYNLIAVVKGTVGLFGGITYESKETIAEKLRFVDYYADVHAPLAEGSIGLDMKNLLDMLQPVLANMMGELGENFHFFIFDSRNSSEKLIANPYQDHDFVIRIGEDEEFVFDLPLSSLIMAKKCPKDGKEYNGKWTYCPFDGTKLVDKQ